jgi:hypothetical protein
LIVNADAVLAFAIAEQRLKAIAGQGREVSQRSGRLKAVKLETR